MAAAPERPSLPGWIVVVGGLLLAFLLFRIVSVVLGTIFLVAKLAVVAVVVVAVGTLLARKRDR